MPEIPSRRTRSRAPAQTSHETTLSVWSSSLGVEEEKRKVISVSKFETDPAFVRVNAGVTKNLGNFESLRVDVSITAPCYIEEIEKVEKRVAEMVAAMLDEEVEEYLGKE